MRLGKIKIKIKIKEKRQRKEYNKNIKRKTSVYWLSNAFSKRESTTVNSRKSVK